MSKASQAAWNTLREKLKSSPDYVIVRKTAQANVLAGETKIGNDDYATSYFELNILDLPAGGGGGPAYDDSVIVKDLEDLQTEVDDVSAKVDANKAQIDINTKRIFDQSGAISTKVNISEGQSTLSIWRGTATEYGALAADPNTLYFIIQ